MFQVLQESTLLIGSSPTEQYKPIDQERIDTLQIIYTEPSDGFRIILKKVI
jgi:hypothetical protein